MTEETHDHDNISVKLKFPVMIQFFVNPCAYMFGWGKFYLKRKDINVDKSNLTKAIFSFENAFDIKYFWSIW